MSGRKLCLVKFAKELFSQGISRGGGGTPYNGLYGEAPHERGTIFRMEVEKREGIS